MRNELEMSAMDLMVVLGGGESGVGAALLAQKKGYQVFLSDKGAIQEDRKAILTNKGIDFEEGIHSLNKIYQAKEVIKSPGIPDTISLVKELKERGIPVISEIEFASRYTRAKIIGITGTNGKTTTTRLISHILLEAGEKIGMVGNVGFSFARSLYEEKEKKAYVLELSSFQLDGLTEFRANIAMILNISPDHLDRYNYKLENYIASKFGITNNQQESDYFIYNADDQNIVGFLSAKKIKAKTITIEKSMAQFEKVEIEDQVFTIGNPSLKGPHNRMNALFAIQTALLMEINTDSIQKGLDTFVNVPHRLEWIRDFEGVSYYNDSKATNVDAVFSALEAMDKGVIWIVGGQDKGNAYDQLLSLVKEKVRIIVCLGIDNSKIITAFEQLGKPIFETRSAEEAAKVAYLQAKKGESVLLSPACASFDLFDNYKDRGNKFKAAVNALKA